MKSRSERGNTLVELLAATVIIGIISFALSESLISGLKNTGDTQERLTGSIDRQRVAAAFVPDAQSAQTPPDTGVVCGDPVSAPGDEVVGNLRWSDGDDVASYLVVDSKLVRRFCSGGSDEPADDPQVLAGIEEGAVARLVAASAPSRRLSLRICPEAAGCDAPVYDVPRPGYEVEATRKSSP